MWNRKSAMHTEDGYRKRTPLYEILFPIGYEIIPVSDVEAEVHDIAVGDFILLTFKA